MPVKKTSKKAAKKRKRTVRGTVAQKQTPTIIRAVARDERRIDAAAPTTLQTIQGYYAEVREVLSWNAADPLFTSLAARIWEHGNTRADWLVSPDSKASKDVSRIENEQAFWNTWSTDINKDLNNVLDGMDTINLWIFKRLILTGMAVSHWQWGYMPFRGNEIWAPVKLKIEPSLAIRFTESQDKMFGQETTWLFRDSKKKGDVPSGYTSSGKYPSVVNEARFSADDLKKDARWTPLRPSTSFAIKLDWVPDDDRVIPLKGSYALIPTQLPNVRWTSLEEPMRLRKILRRGDLAILDALINYIIHWKVGNDATDEKGRLINQPRPERKDASGAVIEKSTIDQVKELIDTDNISKAMELILPYWIDFEVKTPDAGTLLNVEKYFHATQCVFESFGIYRPSMKMGGSSAGSSGTNDDRDNFINYVENVRQHHIARYWEMVARKVMRHPKNKGVLKHAPKYVFRELRLRTDEYRQALANVAKMGQCSVESLHRAYNLHPKVERTRIARELKDGTMDAVNEHVPVQFSQETVDPSGKVTKNNDSKDTSRGRPRTKPSKEK